MFVQFGCRNLEKCAFLHEFLAYILLLTFINYINLNQFGSCILFKEEIYNNIEVY